MGRLFISHLLYKGQIFLHRRFLYMESPSSQDIFSYSREACLSASLNTLHIQQVLDEETCPSGQLHMMRWRLSSVMNHQFLTATMVLCSLLYCGQTLQRKEEIVAALEKTRSIWLRRSPRSREATRAAETVNVVLARVMLQSDAAFGDAEAGDVANRPGDWLTPPVPTNSTTPRDEATDREKHLIISDCINNECKWLTPRYPKYIQTAHGLIDTQQYSPLTLSGPKTSDLIWTCWSRPHFGMNGRWKKGWRRIKWPQHLK